MAVRSRCAPSQCTGSQSYGCVWQQAAAGCMASAGDCCHRQQLAAQLRNQCLAGQQVADAEACKRCKACKGWPTPDRPPASCSAPMLPVLLAASSTTALVASCCWVAACMSPGHEFCCLLPAPACTPPGCPSGAAAIKHCSLRAITADALIRRQRRCWLQQMPAVRLCTVHVKLRPGGALRLPEGHNPLLPCRCGLHLCARHKSDDCGHAAPPI